MSFDLLLWRPRAGSRRTRGFVYSVLCSGVLCDAVAVVGAYSPARIFLAMRARHSSMSA